MWVAFNVFVLVMLAVDLGVLHRRAHEVRLKEALVWSAIWIALALLFALGVYSWYGPQSALEFLTGYLIEKSLSVDNIFVFVLIFSYFKVPARYQHKVLLWGILGALVMRAIFIFAGIALLQRLHWIIYVFGALLILTGIKMATEKDKEIHPDKNLVLKLFRRLVPVTEDYHADRFFIKHVGHYAATPLFIVLLVVETTDITPEKIASWKKDGFKAVAIVLGDQSTAAGCQRIAKARSRGRTSGLSDSNGKYRLDLQGASRRIWPASGTSWPRRECATGSRCYHPARQS
jgi:TerC family integral membrane protein